MHYFPNTVELFSNVISSKENVDHKRDKLPLPDYVEEGYISQKTTFGKIDRETRAKNSKNVSSPEYIRKTLRRADSIRIQQTNFPINIQTTVRKS